MKHLLSCSFGKDSLATLILAHEHGEPVDEIVYCEVMFDETTSGEQPEHAAFINEVAIPKITKDFGYKVTRIRAEKNYIELHNTPISKGPRAGMLRGSPQCRGCWVQRDLKVRPLERYQKTQPAGSVSYVGIEKNEETRLQRLTPGRQVSLLAKYGCTKQDAIRLCQDNGLLSPIYKYARRNGCFFCPNCNIGEFRHLRAHNPQLWGKMLELEATPGVVKKNYTREHTLAALELSFDVEDRQVSIFDLL